MAIDQSKELFGRQPVLTVRPITADMCTIVWAKDPGTAVVGPTQGSVVSGATNITISYQQQVVRRRTLATSGGRPVAVIYPTQPQGSIQIQRLFADVGSQLGSPAANDPANSSTHDIFNFPGWNICKGPAAITVSFNGESAYKDCASKNAGYQMTGAMVTSYNISAEAEGLTVVDNVSVEFLQMFPSL